jgi:hypothetical protein
MNKHVTFRITKGKVKDGTWGFFLTTSANTPSMILGSALSQYLKEETIFRIKDCLNRMNLTVDELYEAKVVFNQEECFKLKIRRIQERTFNLKQGLQTLIMSQKEMDFFAEIFFSLLCEVNT